MNVKLKNLIPYPTLRVPLTSITLVGKVLGCISILQIVIFAIVLQYYSNNSLFKCPCKRFGLSFSIAKASATLININIFIIFLSMSNTIRKFIYIKFKNKSIHIVFSIYLIIWSFIHVVCHYINILKTNIDDIFLINWGVGLTGHILLLLIILFVSFSIPYFRRSFYSFFKFMHYIITFIFIIFLCLHGSFCFIKYTLKICPLPTTWMWIVLPCLVLLFELLWKYVYGRVDVNKLIKHPGNILEIQLKLSEWYAGKTVWICCTNINYFEWHPFTITNYNNNICSLHIKLRGDWTSKLFKQNKDIKLLVDGPYHMLPKRINKKNVLFVSTGIGITTFSYIMKKSEYKMYFVIIVKNIKEVEWLTNILNINKDICIWFFFTDQLDNITNFNFNYTLGRPDFNKLLDYIFIDTFFRNDVNIDVYYSGKTKPKRILKEACKKNNRFILQN